VDELQQAAAPMPLHFNLTMLGPVLLKYGTPDQKRDWLPRLARLDVWFCQGFSEPGAGSDLASLRTSARREGDHYVVNGQKIWTTYAHMADWIFCLVRTDASRPAQAGRHQLPADRPEARRASRSRPIHTIDGEHHLNEVFFDDVKVPWPTWSATRRQGLGRHQVPAGQRADGARVRGHEPGPAGPGDRAGAQHARRRRHVLDDPAVQAEIAWLDAELRGLEITNLARCCCRRQAQQEKPGLRVGAEAQGRGDPAADRGADAAHRRPRRARCAARGRGDPAAGAPPRATCSPARRRSMAARARCRRMCWRR
jgi:pimeloyl-CoA dehydrogenase